MPCCIPPPTLREWRPRDQVKLSEAPQRSWTNPSICPPSKGPPKLKPKQPPLWLSMMILGMVLVPSPSINLLKWRVLGDVRVFFERGVKYTPVAHDSIL